MIIPLPKGSFKILFCAIIKLTINKLQSAHENIIVFFLIPPFNKYTFAAAFEIAKNNCGEYIKL